MNEYMKMLGFKGKDRVTGFEGTVASISFDLYGCVQAALTPEVGKDGKAGDGHWYDAKRIEITSKKPVMAAPDYATIKKGKEIGAAEKPRPSTHTQ